MKSYGILKKLTSMQFYSISPLGITITGDTMLKTSYGSYMPYKEKKTKFRKIPSPTLDSLLIFLDFGKNRSNCGPSPLVRKSRWRFNTHMISGPGEGF